MNVVMYTKSGCVNCDRAKALLKSKGLEYSEVDAEYDWNCSWSWLKEHHPDVKQMPLIFIDDQRVGGLAGLQAALKQVGL